MLLNSRNNLFFFNFPRAFVPAKVIERYKPYLNRIPGNIIAEPIDFINYSVQGVDLPSVSYEPVRQIGKVGQERAYRSSIHPDETRSKEMTITMQLLDGYINYWMMLDIFDHYYDIKTKNVHIPDGVVLRILDAEGQIIVSSAFTEVLFKEIGPLQMNFSNNAPDFSTFDCTFEYLDLETKVELG